MSTCRAQSHLSHRAKHAKNSSFMRRSIDGADAFISRDIYMKGLPDLSGQLVSMSPQHTCLIKIWGAATPVNMTRVARWGTLECVKILSQPFIQASLRVAHIGFPAGDCRRSCRPPPECIEKMAFLWCILQPSLLLLFLAIKRHRLFSLQGAEETTGISNISAAFFRRCESH